MLLFVSGFFHCAVSTGFSHVGTAWIAMTKYTVYWRWVHTHFVYPPTDAWLGACTLWLFRITLLQTLVSKCLCLWLFSVLWGIFLQVEFAGSWGSSMLTMCGTTSLFFQSGYTILFTFFMQKFTIMIYYTEEISSDIVNWIPLFPAPNRLEEWGAAACMPWAKSHSSSAPQSQDQDSWADTAVGPALKQAAPAGDPIWFGGVSGRWSLGRHYFWGQGVGWEILSSLIQKCLLGLCPSFFFFIWTITVALRSLNCPKFSVHSNIFFSFR